MTNAAHTRVQAAEADAQIVALALRGESPARIARALGLGIASVRAALYAHARHIRDNSRDLVARRWQRHDEVLTRLIDAWERALRTAFDRDIAAALIRAMERQSKLHGMDATRALDTDKWLNEASDEALREELRSVYGIEVPETVWNGSRG